MKAKKLFVFGALVLAMSTLFSGCDYGRDDIIDNYVYDVFYSSDVSEYTRVIISDYLRVIRVKIGENMFNSGSSAENDRKARNLFEVNADLLSRNMNELVRRLPPGSHGSFSYEVWNTYYPDENIAPAAVFPF